ncbi:M81 family metallopeptidase [Paenibacillus glycinis]|uniref:Microcystin LR degradation protein MlrC n=1 Tax=Paenibacillus glycinis TaxID=2697035 RepID=A0ABW9XNS9_9BACL|nr:M81 family metallopeptidase [Paenibacillus glycinis]NBD24293.1 microcystin LR degradation protein MlrC [Paenibacillus glycinis]
MTKDEAHPGKKARIAVAGIMHETNTFTALRTGLADFTVAAGQEVHAVARWKGNVFDGILGTLDDLGAEAVPVYFARALPSGLIEAAAFEAICDRIADGIAGCGPIDGICLALHGSMCAEGCDDSEGELLARLRAAVGRELPIVCALDMHATVTAAMIAHADAFAAYRTAPHIDEYDTGARAAKLLHEALATGRKLVNEWSEIPVLIAGEQSETGVQPMRDLMEALRLEERAPDAGPRSASYLLGFPWADSPFGGCAAIVSGFEEERAELRQAAGRLAELFWAKRQAFAFSTEAALLEEALDLAAGEPRKPVILSDSGDNPTAGASQDVTLVVQALIARRAERALVATIFDPAAVLACETAGAGGNAELRLGRLNPYETAPSPLPLHAAVVRTGTVLDVNYAVAAVGGITIVISDRRTAVYDPAILEALGLRPGAFDLLVVKSGYLSPAYKALAERTILALTPGDTDERLSELPYRRLRRPIYPLDEM